MSDDERNLDQTPGAGSSRDLTGLHILLVEDSPDIGELVKTLLELEGTIVAGPATTAEEARKLVAERRPHVALVDFHLRDGNAYGLIARLRELGLPRHHDLWLDRISPSNFARGGDYAGKTIQRNAASRVPTLIGGEDNSLSQDNPAYRMRFAAGYPRSGAPRAEPKKRKRSLCAIRDYNGDDLHCSQSRGGAHRQVTVRTARTHIKVGT